jgi:hypothetical protein
MTGQAFPVTKFNISVRRQISLLPVTGGTNTALLRRRQRWQQPKRTGKQEQKKYSNNNGQLNNQLHACRLLSGEGILQK